MDVRPIRRVVTGHDGRGRAVVALDGAPADPPVVLHPPPAGTVFRIIPFDPEHPGALAHPDGATAFAAMAAAGTVVAGARHPYMHRTDTVDYAMVLQGSITTLLDDEDVELRAGDVVIQNGTSHAWANRGDAPCLMAFVLIDAPGDRPR